MIWAIDKFKPYLSHQKFTLVMDHKALTKLKEVKDNNPMLYRWSLKLAGYDYDVITKREKSMRMQMDHPVTLC